ncbi:Pvc16 family protein [Sandarakinorhabdus sp. DWP1-3-1]|uniref:Pvc16 family protein n=1 Tax=Sandarakinorhabdus sp. DWP1-3-1 TaxID=2804627 RepID=UPI003CF651A8
MSDSRAIAAITAALTALLLPIGPGVAPTLYRVTPSSRARNALPRAGTALSRGTAVDLHYMITGAGDIGLQLGAAITALAASPLLDGTAIDRHVVDRGLHGAIAADEHVQLAAEILTLEETALLWQALGQPLQPALFYLVGPLTLA